MDTRKRFNLSFPIDARLLNLARHAVAATKFTFGHDVLFDPAFHLGGKVKEKDGWPISDNIDQTKLSPGFMLVKDQGVYLMSNGNPGLPVDEKKQNICYANEVNPENMAFDEWWEAGRSIMGGDDTVITLLDLPKSVIEASEAGLTALRMNVLKTRLSWQFVKA